MPRALLSVSDKTGLESFARELQQRGWTLLSTGGTARVLRNAGIPVTEVSEMTGHPEIMDGRVKTLHPAVHAGLLGRRGHEGDEGEMRRLGYQPIDLLAVNLYPFSETIARPGVSDAEAIEQIDIGGPAMLRSAAKNHERVWVVVDPQDYPRVLEGLDGPGEAAHLKRDLAVKVFSHTSRYDSAIAGYLAVAPGSGAVGELPAEIDLRLRQVQALRYGENPGQAAALYEEVTAGAEERRLRQLQGKELSFNNLLDVDAAILAVNGWKGQRKVACAIIKHTTPCGLAIADSVTEAYRKALATDPTSAYGSVLAFTAPVTEEAAQLIRPNFVEAIVAPGYDEGARRVLAEKKNLRLLELPDAASSKCLDFKRVQNGFLVQERLRLDLDEPDWKVVTLSGPSEAEFNDLRFAWRAVAAVKSNAILIARDGMTLGIGAGQMSRVDSSRIAVMKAADNGHDLRGAVLSSDAFFPFRDGVDAAAATGIRAIVQPGGSVRDDEVISAANEHGIAMVFTGKRLFRH